MRCSLLQIVSRSVVANLPFSDRAAPRTQADKRLLMCEPLEERRLLSASPLEIATMLENTDAGQGADWGDFGAWEDTATDSSDIPAAPAAAAFGLIADAGLDQAIRDALGIGPGIELTEAVLADPALTSLDAHGRGISSLEGIQFCTSLTQLFLSDNHISDISPLAAKVNPGDPEPGLIRLQLLHLGGFFDYDAGNLITDIGPLSQLTNLNQLWVAECNVSDLSPLAGLDQLRALQLYDNAIVDISPLAGLTGLTQLNLLDNALVDISALSELTHLERLHLGYNWIDDISALRGMTDLQILDLRENRIEDLSPLAGLTKLELLRLNENCISDVSVLSNLVNLENLTLGLNQIADISAISALSVLVELDVSYNPIPIPHLETVISGMTSVTSLGLRGLGISDLSFVGGSTQLVSLNLGDNKIADVTPLGSLNSLLRLSLYNNQLISIASLANPAFPVLERLSISNNEVADLSPLQGKTQLTELRAWNNAITDLTPLVNNADFAAGDILFVTGNPLSIPAKTTRLAALEGRGAKCRMTRTMSHTTLQGAFGAG